MKQTQIMILGTVGVILFIAAFMWGMPNYNLWAREMNGKAELAEASWSRQIKVEEAQANLESQKLNAQAEIERAKGAAEAQRIISETLNPQYLRYLWIQQMEEGTNRQTIYVPTEAGLPILESTRLNQSGPVGE